MNKRSYPDFREVLNKLLPQLDFQKENHPLFGVEFFSSDRDEGYTFNTHICIAGLEGSRLMYKYVDHDTFDLRTSHTHNWGVEEPYSVLRLKRKKISGTRWYPIFGVIETELLQSEIYNGRIPG